MAEVIRHDMDEIDWKFMAEDIVSKGLQGPLYCALSLAQQLIDAPVPQSFLDEIRPIGFSANSAELFTQRLHSCENACPKRSELPDESTYAQALGSEHLHLT